MRKYIDYTKSKSGFTMVELSLTLAFIGVLLITIAVITTNIVTIYQKGMALKAVNSVGRGLIDEFTSSINTAPSVDTTSMCRSLLDTDAAREACIKDHAYKFIYQTAYNNAGQQLNGIFCTGYYSYFWNTYYGIDEDKTISLKYTLKDNGDQTLPKAGEEAIRLTRFKDPNYRLCSANVNRSTYESEYQNNKQIDIQYLYTNGINTDDDIPYIIDEEPTQGMLDSFDLDLMLYELTVFPISQDSVSLRTYMTGTFILATLRGNVDITRTGDYCQPGIYNSATGEIESDTSSLNNLGSEFNYCAINKFNFAGRTAGV